MRKELLLSTAALLAGVVLASAQTAPGGGHSQTGTAAQEHQQSTQSHGTQTQQGSKMQSRENQSQRGESQGHREQTTGQAAQEHKSSGQAERGEQGTQSQREQGMQSQSKQTQSKPPAGRSEREQTTGENREPSLNLNERSQQRQPQPGQVQSQTPRQNGAAEGRIQSNQAQIAGGKSLTSEQQTRIRETIMANRDVPRVNNVTFPLRLGMVVPSSVRVVEVPETMVEIYPDWRSDEYFVVGDDIVRG
jgi:hypothetical protein